MFTAEDNELSPRERDRMETHGTDLLAQLSDVHGFCQNSGHHPDFSRRRGHAVRRFRI